MKSAVFFHRSVGHNLIHDGNVHQLFKNKDLHFSDYDQNLDELTSADGKHRQMGFVFPGSNTRPQDYARIFTHNVTVEHQPIQAFALLHDIIIIKSCYPNSNIKSDAQLQAMQADYRSIADFFKQYPNKRLIIVTSPPLVPLMTNPNRARRARVLAKWLATVELGENVAVFDFYECLADSKHGWLKRAYRRWLPIDSHPNPTASEAIAPLFTQTVTKLAG